MAIETVGIKFSLLKDNVRVGIAQSPILVIDLFITLKYSLHIIPSPTVYSGMYY